MSNLEPIGDLHLHTCLSDGSCAPHEVIAKAARAGLSYIAITDHDHFTSTPDLVIQAQSLGVTLIDGVEVSCCDPVRGRKVHILCYLPQNADRSPVKTLCDDITARRVEAGRTMAARVAELYPITVDEVEAIASRCVCIYKQHIVKALMDSGITVRIFGELYDRLFDTHKGSCIVNFPQPEVYTVISAIKKAGGLCVLAHPYTYNSIDLLNELTAQGLLDGIEVWSSKSTPEQEQYLAAVAEQFDLIKTGGSDFHGAYGSRPSPIGVKPTPAVSIERIIEKLQSTERNVSI